MIDSLDYCFLLQSSWYTRRIGLASILKITEVYLLQDNSPNQEATWKFLNQRISEGVVIQKFFENSEEKAMQGISTVGNVFETV